MFSAHGPHAVIVLPATMTTIAFLLRLFAKQSSYLA